ncbi:hypothetical protein ACA910_010163 [Epithemia clementina (nom. ined.)]
MTSDDAQLEDARILYPCILHQKSFTKRQSTEDQESKKIHGAGANPPLMPVLLAMVATVLMVAFLWQQQQQGENSFLLRWWTATTTTTNTNDQPMAGGNLKETAPGLWTSIKEHFDHISSRLAMEFGTGKIHWANLSLPSWLSAQMRLLGIHDYNHLHDPQEQGVHGGQA